MSCTGEANCSCGCCAGIAVLTPQGESNPPGQASIAYRTGTWATFKDSMLARLSSSDYPALAAQGIYSDAATGIRVFAGQRAETFYIDLGAVFDTLNLRRYLPLLSAAEDADNVNPFGVNRFSGSNVSTSPMTIRCVR